MIDYAKLAQKVFQPQMVVDIDRVLEICKELILEAGDIWEIAKNGYVYKKVKHADKVHELNPEGWCNQLVTRADHPAFDY